MSFSRVSYKVVTNIWLALRSVFFASCAACGIVGQPPRILPAWHLDVSVPPPRVDRRARTHQLGAPRLGPQPAARGGMTNGP